MMMFPDKVQGYSARGGISDFGTLLSTQKHALDIFQPMLLAPDQPIDVLDEAPAISCTSATCAKRVGTVEAKGGSGTPHVVHVVISGSYV